jgi:hypothetical protein
MTNVSLLRKAGTDVSPYKKAIDEVGFAAGPPH